MLTARLPHGLPLRDLGGHRRRLRGHSLKDKQLTFTSLRFGSLEPTFPPAEGSVTWTVESHSCGATTEPTLVSLPTCIGKVGVSFHAQDLQEDSRCPVPGRTVRGH